jgi:hypothetical protein
MSKDIVQCARQYGFNLGNLVARGNQMVNGSDNWQTSTYVSLVFVHHTIIGGSGLQTIEFLNVTACGNLVGTYDGDVVVNEVLIQVGYLIAGCAIDKNQQMD